jgi:hypothetical protein
VTPCMGGWCRKRAACDHYTAPDGEPVERLCAPGMDEPVRIIPIKEQKDSMSRPKHTAKIHTDAQAVADYIRLTGGQQLTGIARHFGFGRDYLYDVMGVAPGIVKFRLPHGATTWVTVEDAALRTAAMQARRKAKDAERGRNVRQAAAMEGEDAADWAIQQSIIPASGAMPPATNAPRWVFDLGRAA